MKTLYLKDTRIFSKKFFQGIDKSEKEGFIIEYNSKNIREEKVFEKIRACSIQKYWESCPRSR